MAPVRLRSRLRRSSGTEGPAEPSFTSWTTLGNLDGTVRAMVDPAGRVAIEGGGWSLDWWIGAEDRWHLPAQEAAVRQQLVGSSPVVETRVRIPTGDAVSRAYGARGPCGEDLLVVEVHNDSKVPVALALTVQPHGEGGRIDALGLTGSVLEVDGDPAIHLARSPGRVAFSTADDARDAGAVVLAGDAEPVRAVEVACDAGHARGVLLFPLAHTASLRVAIVLDGAERSVDPAALPSAEQVASGWATHSRGGARIEVPDRRLRDAVAASTRFLLLAAEEPAAALALEHLGFPDEAARCARGTIDERTAGARLAHLASHWRFTGEAPATDPLEIARLVHLTMTSRSADQAAGRAAIPWIAELLEAMDERRAAGDLRSLHLAHPAPATPPAEIDGLLGVGHDLATDAALVLAVRAHLVQDLDDGVALSPVIPDAWLGQGWEVHDLPTASGRLSFAIRWHGERPALLWDLEPRPDHPVRLTCPVLDPSWSSIDPKGEALLAPVPVPDRPHQRRGLTIPVTIEPMRPRP